MRHVALPLAGIVLLFAATLEGANDRRAAADHVLSAEPVHLRSGREREWNDFPETADRNALELRFGAEVNPAEWTLAIRQRDVKQAWKVTLNETLIGTLVRDENDQVTLLAVPAGTIRAGDNVLRIATAGMGASDDVVLGPVILHPRPREALLGDSSVEVTVRDAESGEPIPCRLTLVDADGALAPVQATSEGPLAIRTGIVYTATGTARLSMPKGRYRLYAGRGFEYGLATADLDLTGGPGDAVALSLCREVATPGYVACDTHCHTLTHSGHGDATIEERMVTIAGEGIELPVAADHNVVIDYEPVARAAGVRRYFTPVRGSEVTTPKQGHLNVFPIAQGAAKIDHAATDWKTLFEEIRRTPDVKVILLNHARDIHGGYRPFDPQHHLSSAGERLDGRVLEANAMELINSGTTQRDPYELFHDWQGLLNRGHRIAPIGSSDSHDVARHFVGQGRTYVRCDDRDPAKIDVDQACTSIADGRVLVSYGLLCDIAVNEKFGPGDVVPGDGPLKVKVRVSGPTWTRVSSVALYANGMRICEAAIDPESAEARRAGLKWETVWSLPEFPHDVHLSAIAMGPGIRALFWPTAKPYQPDSPEWEPYVWGSTAAVWVDADASGAFDSARTYAVREWESTKGNRSEYLKALSRFDEAVAVQGASLLRESGIVPTDPGLAASLREAAPQVRRGFAEYAHQWRESQIRRME